MGRSVLDKGGGKLQQDEHESVDAPAPESVTSLERTIFLAGVVEEQSSVAVQAQLMALASQNRSPIYLIVSTYGGSIDEMFGLYDLIKYIRSLDVLIHTIGLGKVQSAGVLLMAAGTKGARSIGVNASLMLHPLAASVSGNIFELERSVQEGQRQQRLLTAALQAETSMKTEQIGKIMRAGHDYYISSAEAVKLGIADRILGERS